MPVLGYRGTPVYIPTALKRSLERSEEVSPLYTQKAAAQRRDRAKAGGLHHWRGT